MQHELGWAGAALVVIVILFPSSGYSGNPKSILGKTVHLHYKKSLKTTRPGLFVPSQSIETVIARSQLRIQNNGDLIAIDLSTAERAFERDSGNIYKLGQDINFLASPERTSPARFKNADFSYWIGGAAFEQNILSVTNRLRYVDKRSGFEVIGEAKLVIAISPDGKKCEIRSMTQKSTSERMADKALVEGAMLHQISCRIRSPLELEPD